jgi:putative membrane protein
MTLASLFLAFHVVGVIFWVGGLLTLTVLLSAMKAETDAAARKRLAAFTRKAAVAPDIAATVAIIFGLHWLFAYKIYKFHYMHAKLLLVVILLGLHGFLRVQTKRAAESGESKLPAFARPLLVLLALGIVVVVITKFPS